MEVSVIKKSVLVNLFKNLPLSSDGMTFELFSEKLAAQVNYNDNYKYVGSADAVIKNS